VLFAPQARDAWGLLITAEEISWLGRPDERVQKAIMSSLQPAVAPNAPAQ
jgi:hypothetical protein